MLAELASRRPRPTLAQTYSGGSRRHEHGEPRASPAWMGCRSSATQTPKPVRVHGRVGRGADALELCDQVAVRQRGGSRRLWPRPRSASTRFVLGPSGFRSTQAHTGMWSGSARTFSEVRSSYQKGKSSFSTSSRGNAMARPQPRRRALSRRPNGSAARLLVKPLVEVRFVWRSNDL